MLLRATSTHQVEVVTRRTQYRLRKAQDRAHIVEGLVRALDMIDAVIELIRGGADVAAARDALMAEPFAFSEIQANYILDMQLRRLTQLEGASCARSSRSCRRRSRSWSRSSKSEREAPRRDQGRAPGAQGQVRRRAAYASSSSTPARSTSLDLIDDEEVVVVLTATATSRRSPPTRSAARVGVAVACAGAEARDDDYVESSSRPPRTRTCCCSRTAARSTDCGRTRSR